MPSTELADASFASASVVCLLCRLSGNDYRGMPGQVMLWIIVDYADGIVRQKLLDMRLRVAVLQQMVVGAERRSAGRRGVSPVGRDTTDRGTLRRGFAFCLTADAGLTVIERFAP